MFLILLLAMLPVCALAAEGDPLLSVDDLLSLQDSYDAFLDELESLIVERGLLSPEERRICIPIINPTARRAAEITKCRRIGVIATERTVKSHAFKNELREILPDAEVTEIPAQRLVSLAEECDSAAYASTKAINEIEKILSPIKEICPDTLILGCTHFPIFKQIISDRLPDTAIVSCSQEGARALSSVSEDEGCGRLEFIF